VVNQRAIICQFIEGLTPGIAGYFNGTFFYELIKNLFNFISPIVKSPGLTENAYDMILSCK